MFSLKIRSNQLYNVSSKALQWLGFTSHFSE